MRSAVLAIAMAACGGSGEPTGSLIDAQSSETCVFYVCFDHTVWKTQPQPVNGAVCPPPDFDGVEEYAHCEYGCDDRGVRQVDPLESCLPRPLTPFVCDAVGSCAQGSEQSCTELLGCEITATFGTCTCATGTWECSPVCSDGLCGPAAVQAVIAGNWLGTVDKPTAPAATYANVTLTIKGDGDWEMRGSNELLFQWGTGVEPGTAIVIQGQTATGGVGTMRLQPSLKEALIHDVRVQGDRLQATIEMNCSQTYVLDLQRVQ